MSPVSAAQFHVTVLGSGDAFGSGGRLQTCFHVEAAGHPFLIDCGVTALIGMKRFGMDPGSIETVLISHFHADHAAGLPLLLLDARISGRAAPLTIAGPPGIRAHVENSMRILFPGTDTAVPFEVRFLEYGSAEALSVGPLQVNAFPVLHSPATRPHAVRVEVAGRVVAYSGDTEWTPVLSTVAHEADLFICECSGLEVPVPVHLDHATLLRHRPDLDCRRLLLTHMGAEVLANADRVSSSLGAILADDGFVLDLTGNALSR